MKDIETESRRRYFEEKSAGWQRRAVKHIQLSCIVGRGEVSHAAKSMAYDGSGTGGIAAFIAIRRACQSSPACDRPLAKASCRQQPLFYASPTSAIHARVASGLTWSYWMWHASKNRLTCLSEDCLVASPRYASSADAVRLLWTLLTSSQVQHPFYLQFDGCISIGRAIS